MADDDALDLRALLVQVATGLGEAAFALEQTGVPLVEETVSLVLEAYLALEQAGDAETAAQVVQVYIALEEAGDAVREAVSLVLEACKDLQSVRGVIPHGPR